VQTYTIVSAADEPYAVIPATASANLQGVATVTDGDGNTTSYTLDFSGRLLQEVQPENIVQTWTYDSHGQNTSYTDGRGFATDYIYAYGPSDGDMIAVVDPNLRTEMYTYDPVFHNVTEATDEDGNETTSRTPASFANGQRMHGRTGNAVPSRAVPGSHDLRPARLQPLALSPRRPGPRAARARFQHAPGYVGVKSRGSLE
jgi:YD repeat-containing protein